MLVVNKPLLNVPAHCLSFLSLTQHGVGLRNGEAVCAVNCSFGPAGFGNARSVTPDPSRKQRLGSNKVGRGCGFPDS